MIKEKDIIYEEGKYWVYENPGKSYYEVYKIGITHSTRCASIGKTLGIERCKKEISRRINEEKQQRSQRY